MKIVCAFVSSFTYGHNERQTHAVKLHPPHNPTSARTRTQIIKVNFGHLSRKPPPPPTYCIWCDNRVTSTLPESATCMCRLIVNFTLSWIRPIEMSYLTSTPILLSSLDSTHGGVKWELHMPSVDSPPPPPYSVLFRIRLLPPDTSPLHDPHFCSTVCSPRLSVSTVPSQVHDWHFSTTTTTTPMTEVRRRIPLKTTAKTATPARGRNTPSTPLTRLSRASIHTGVVLTR